MINIIVATVSTEQGLLMGVDNKLPWHDRKDKYSKRDMAWFKDCTWGDTVIMGRKTWESMGSKPLKNRMNRIVSSTMKSERNMFLQNPSIHLSLNDASKSSYEQFGLNEFGIKKDDSTTWIIGGSSLYQEALAIADRIFMTHMPVYESAQTDQAPFARKEIDYIKGGSPVYFPFIPESFVKDYQVELIPEESASLAEPLMVTVYKRKK